MYISCSQSKRQYTHICRSSRHFVAKQLCAHEKLKIYLFNVFVMYALNSAHETVRRVKLSRSFADLFDKPGQIEWQIDPNTNLSNQIDSNVEFYIRLT